jgi:mRNA-degrading endonuclease RelE of RelBE toxin-antitoxin system
MRIEISNSAFKFLENRDEKTRKRIIEKIAILKNSLEEAGIIPYKVLDIKTLKGNWYPHKRLRIGKIRIIFIIDFNSDVIKIQEIDDRGDIY